MKIPYRITSGVVLGAYLLYVVLGLLRSLHDTLLLVSYGPMHNLTILVSSGAFLVFMVQGLRNRSGPRWLAIAGVLSLALQFEDEWPIGAGGAGLMFCILYGSIAAMLLHHAVRPWGEDRKWPKTNRFVALAYGGVISAFVLMMAVWFVIRHIVLLTRAYDSENATILMSIVNCGFGWPAYGLFFFAVFLTVYRSNVVRQIRSTEFEPQQ
jgi:hypothetical protein